MTGIGALSFHISWFGAIWGIFCAYSAELPVQTNQVRTIGIARFEGLSAEEESAYPYLEARLKRWIEDNTKYNVQSLGTVSIPTDFDRAASLSKIDKLSNKMVEHLTKGLISPDLSGSSKELLSLVGIYDVQDIGGLLVQKAYLVLAAYYWQLNDMKKAQSMAETAMALHPDGRFYFPFSWDDDDNVSHWLSFEAMLKKVAHKGQRNCVIEVEGNRTSFSELAVNGFSLGQAREVRAQLGRRYFFQAEGNQGVAVQCRVPGVKKVIFSKSLVSSHVATNHSLARLPVIGIKSIVLVKPEGGRFSFYLYTPGSRRMGVLGSAIGSVLGTVVDEIPVERPVRVADLTNVGSTLPISTDAFMSLVDRSSQFELPLHINTSDTLVEVASDLTWYNNWKVWTIAGVVLGGIAAAYYATRHNQVGSQYQPQPQSQVSTISVTIP